MGYCIVKVIHRLISLKRVGHSGNTIGKSRNALFARIVKAFDQFGPNTSQVVRGIAFNNNLIAENTYLFCCNIERLQLLFTRHRSGQEKFDRGVSR